MADRNEKVTHNNIRQFAGLVDGYATGSVATVGEDFGKAELAQLTEQQMMEQGWEFAPTGAPSGDSLDTYRAQGWEFPEETKDTSLLEDFQIGLSNVGNMVDKGATMAQKGMETLFNMRASRKDTDKPDTAKPVDMTDPKLFEKMDAREQVRNQWANPEKKQQGFGGTLTSAVSTLPMQVVAAPLSAIDTAVEFIRKGESLEDAYKAAGIDSAFTALGIYLPATVGKTLLQKAFVGGGSNAVLDIMSRLGIVSQAKQEETKKQFAPTKETTAVAGVIGAGTGAMMKTGTKQPSSRTRDIVTRTQDTLKQQPTELKGQGELFPVGEEVASPYNPNRLAEDIVSPVDHPALARRQMELQLDQRPTEYVDTLGRPQHETTVRPDETAQYHKAVQEGDIAARVEQEAMLRKQGSVPEAPQQRNLIDFADEQPMDRGVRHPDPDNGRPVQGMDESVPTIDFPLRQQVLDADSPRINQMRQMIAEQEAFNRQAKASGATPERIAALEDSLNHLKQLFADDMAGYGVKNAGDAHGLRRPMFEKGKGTQLPIKQTHNAGKGGFGFKNRKNQGGAIHPDLLTGGLAKLVDKAGRQYVDPVIARLAEAYKKYLTDPSENVVLKEGEAGTRVRTALREAENDLIALGVKKSVDPITHMREVDEILKQVDKVARDTAFNKQSGAINPKAIREGINILKEKFSKKGIPDVVARGMAEEAGQPKKPDPVINTSIKALKDSIVGEGLADFTYLDKKPEEVIQIVKEWDQDIDRKPVQEAIENGGLFRGLDTKHPLVKYATERMTRATQAAQKLIHDYLTNHDDGLKQYFRDMTPTEKGELWYVMMENEGKRMLSEDELRNIGLNDAQIGAYMKFFDVDNSIFTKINEARKTAGLAPMDHRIAHIAGRFNGDFRVGVKRPVLDAQGNPKFDENGKFVMEYVGFIGDNTRWGLKRALKFMQEKHPDWAFGEIEYKKITEGNSAASRLNGLMEVMNLVSKNDPGMQSLLDSYKELLKSDAVKYLNATRHAKAKKSWAGGIEGSEGHKPWKDFVKNAEEGMRAQLTYMEQSFQWLEMQKATDDLSTILKDPDVVEKHKNATEWTSMYSDHILGKNSGQVATALNSILESVGRRTGLGHTNIIKGTDLTKKLMMQKFMGFMNIPFTITQLVQPLQTIPPAMMLMKSRGIEFSALKAGAEATGTMMKQLYHNASRDTNKYAGKTVLPDSKFTAFERAAIDYAHEHAVFDVRIVDHTRDINQSRLMDAYDWAAEANIKYPEMATRGTAYMFYAHALKETGMPLKDVFSTAENLTRMSMVDYTPTARPMMYNQLGWMGDLASTLSRYKHNQVNQLTFYGREARKGLGRGDVMATTPLLTHIATSLAFGGIVGLTGYNTMDLLYRQFMSTFFQEDDTLMDLIMRTKELPDYITHGMAAGLGVDMSSRFSNAKVIPESAGEFLVPFGSGVADVAGAAWAFGKNPNEWNAKRLGKAVAPSSMTGLIENEWFSVPEPDGSYRTINSRTMEANFNRTEKERSLRNYGFRSMRESSELNRVYQNTVIGMKEVERQDSIVEKAFSDMLSGNWSPVVAKQYAEKYVAANGDPDTFAKKFETRLRKYNMNADERFKYQNMGNNVTAAMRMKRYNNPGYNK